tara:strand:+ start:569 stop:967 length:399 start_codon:yes stop_codon:yes gene_type:complete
MGKLKLLLAEDEEDSQILFEKAVGSGKYKDNFDLTMVSNGIETVEAYKKIEPDIVVLDILMPESTGYEALKAIRNIEKSSNRSAVIIMLTSLQDEYYEEKAEDLWADGYIKKPINVEEIGEQIYSFYKKKNP